MELRIFFRFRDRRDEWRRGACPLFFACLNRRRTLFCCSLLNDGTLLLPLLPLPPSLPQVPGICSPVLLFDVTTYLVYIWSRFFGGSLWKMLSPKNYVVVFLQSACCLFFPLSPSSRHSGSISLCAPQRKRRKERENLCISLSTQQFLQQQPLEKMAKKRNSNPTY